MPDILTITVPNGGSAIVWSSRDASVQSLLFVNQDLNNTVYVGNSPALTIGTNTIPIPPNGTFSGSSSSNWYCTGSVAGIKPLVVVPNGQAYFLGLTQGSGNLALPSMQSPNFETGIQGWQITKTGNVEFNNGVFRGTVTAGTFNGTQFIINANGQYFYSGIPAVGNEIASITFVPSNDPFGNATVEGFTVYTGNTPTDFFTAFGQTGINWGLNSNAPTGTGHISFGSPTGVNSDVIKTWDPSSGFPTVETEHTVTYQNSWARADATSDLNYSLQSNGMVQISGRLTAGATVATGGPTTVATVLPSYIPSRNEPITGICHNAASPFTTNTTCTLLINISGNIQFFGNYNAGQNLEIQSLYPLKG